AERAVRVAAADRRAVHQGDPHGAVVGRGDAVRTLPRLADRDQLDGGGRRRNLSAHSVASMVRSYTTVPPTRISPPSSGSVASSEPSPCTMRSPRPSFAVSATA